LAAIVHDEISECDSDAVVALHERGEDQRAILCRLDGGLRLHGRQLPAIFRYDWVRIFVFAGLRGVGISQRYLDLIQKKVVEPVGLELRRVAGIAEEPARALSAAELEIAWSLHGELFYLAIRRWVYDMKTPDDLGAVIRAAVVGYLEGAPAAIRNLSSAAPHHRIVCRRRLPR
jgi:hypothetical protein